MKKETQKLIQALHFPISFIIILWIVQIVRSALNMSLGAYGIYPRAVDGLKGIFLAPLIHGDYHHLISNSVPLIVLTFIIYLFYRRVALASFLLIYVLTGFAVWLFARPVYHIGASGLVYGLVAFVFWNGIFRRNMKSIVLALVVTILYSGYFMGILPNQEGISWESHLFGGVVGIFVSFLFKGVVEKEDTPEDPWAQESLEKPKYFFERDVFEKTKEERKREKDDWFSSNTWDNSSF